MTFEVPMTIHITIGMRTFLYCDGLNPMMQAWAATQTAPTLTDNQEKIRQNSRRERGSQTSKDVWTYPS